MRVIVIGAGVLGVRAARHPSVAGAEVVLLDHRGAGTGTSATTSAWVDSNRKHDVDRHGLDLAGMQEHARLAERLPGPGSYFPSGAWDGWQRPRSRPVGSRTSCGRSGPPGSSGCGEDVQVDQRATAPGDQ